MDTTQASLVTRFKVGVFAIIGLFLIAAISILVNHRPYWWRTCQYVRINIEDATGLKTKSPIRSLGIEIGYLRNIELTESHVTLGICLTAPIEVLPATRAYIRAEGFLGDKFVELKPVKYTGSSSERERFLKNENINTRWIDLEKAPREESRLLRFLDGIFLIPSARAADSPELSQTPRSGREIPVGEESQDIQKLVGEMSGVTHDLKSLTRKLEGAIDADQLKRTMRQLNQVLENASRTISPEGGLNQTAQRSLAKLEDAIEQLRDIMTRVNKGEGSVGRLLNDPAYADEILQAIRNVNHLLNKVNEVRFVIDIGGTQLPAYSGGRGFFHLGIWPKPDRYYLLGVGTDPRGRIMNTTVTTSVGDQSWVTRTQVVEPTAILFTAMIGKIFFNRLDLSIGMLYGDGTGSIKFYLGPSGYENRIQLRNDIYARNSAAAVDDRITLLVYPTSVFYLNAGLESMRGHPLTGKTVYSLGAGITFDDQDIKLLFAFR